MSDRPAWGEPQGPAGGDQPADDAWAAPAPDPGAEPGPPPASEPGPPSRAEPGPPPAAEATSESAPAEAASESAPAEAGASPPSAAPRLPPPPGEPPADPNAVAIASAGLSEEAASWLREVAGQVEPRLDRVSPRWRESAQAGAARACAFGLLLGYLARLYPHAREDLSRAAEAHPSYSTLASGGRLQTLQQISGEPQRMAAWLGPLIDVSDPQRMQALLD